jgi:hypothetical protein
MIGTDCIGSCKSNYHTISTTTAPNLLVMGSDYIGEGVIQLYREPVKRMYDKVVRKHRMNSYTVR